MNKAEQYFVSRDSETYVLNSNKLPEIPYYTSYDRFVFIK